MTEKGVVKKINGDVAIVSVTRTDMCGKCDKKECSGTCEIKLWPLNSNKLETYALNSISAEVGDIVEVYSPDKKIYAYAFFVFIFPILAAFVGYFIFHLLCVNDLISAISFFVFLGISYTIVCLSDKWLKKEKPLVVINKIVEKTYDESAF